MLTFKRYVNEKLEPLFGKNRGWGDSKNIDGHQVTVQHRKNLFGKTYKPYVTVNGKFHKTQNHTPETNSKIIGFVKDSTKEFLRTKHPPKVKFKAGGDTEAKNAGKQKVYDAFARSKVVAGAGYAATQKKSSVVVKSTATAPHTMSGKVERDKENPVHASVGDSKKKKKWKPDKGDVKSGKFDIKKHIKKAFAGAGGDFGGGGSSGSW